MAICGLCKSLEPKQTWQSVALLGIGIALVTLGALGLAQSTHRFTAKILLISLGAVMIIAGLIFLCLGTPAERKRALDAHLLTPRLVYTLDMGDGHTYPLYALESEHAKSIDIQVGQGFYYLTPSREVGCYYLNYLKKIRKGHSDDPIGAVRGNSIMLRGTRRTPLTGATSLSEYMKKQKGGIHFKPTSAKGCIALTDKMLPRFPTATL